MGLRQIDFKGVHWINMALDSNKWRNAVKPLMKFQVL
jgi:hypothetical protein